MEAQASAVVTDFGKFAPDPRFRQVVPQVDNSQDIASFLLLVLQVCLTNLHQSFAQPLAHKPT